MVRPRVSEDDRASGRELGARLRESRLQAGLSAQALAEASEVSIDTVRSLEIGRVAAPSFMTIARIAGALGVSLDELLASIKRAPERKR
ncbi:helix-turn-helix transcriptional regulator [Kribbella sp. NPDC056861]|uniref:helix-turn-helix domain-containing protein n=1 Tax=Kribbella sp. NPDC056861 TaxID=3154857 RepID=UPI00343FF777